MTTAYGQPEKILISCGFTRLDLLTSTCFCLSWCVAASVILGANGFWLRSILNPPQRKLIKKHGISFKSAARIFFDYDRIEFYDEDHSDDEDRYNTIGDTSAGRISQKAEGALIGNIDQFIGKVNEILFVVYTERVRIEESGTKTDVTRLISARMATEFERGLYYGKNE